MPTDVLGALQTLRETTFVNEDGDVESITFAPGMSEAEVGAFEAGLGAPLPSDYHSLLLACRGIDGLTVELDFAPGEPKPWESEIVPHGIPFGHDGYGNHWIVDLASEPEDEATVFFDGHDAPVLLFQGRGMAGFLLDLIPLQKDEPSPLDDVHEDRLFDVWRTNPDTLPRTEALASPDPTIRAFAEGLDDAFGIVDLRDVPPGMGLSWGRYGPRTRLRRFGRERIFACAPPERKPGWFRRLFGG